MTAPVLRPSDLFAQPTQGPFLYGTYSTPPANRQLPRLRVYIDETGDRNFRANRQSDWFTMSAVIVPEERDPDLRLVAGGLRHVIGLKAGAMLHWKEHFRPRQDWRRVLAADTLSRVPEVKLVHAILHKPSVVQDAHMRAEPDAAYNYLAKLLLERVATTAQEWPGGSRLAVVKLGVVGGVSHEETSRYLNHVACNPRSGERRVPWGNLSWPLEWQQSAHLDGLQIADLYAGMMHAAIHHQAAQHLLACAHQHRRAPYAGRQLLGYGVKVHPPAGVQALQAMSWWGELTRRNP